MTTDTADTAVIAIDQLVRRYGRTDAVNGLDLRVPAGRDAADVAFLTVIGGQVNFVSLLVSSTSDEFVLDDHLALVQLQ